MYGRGAWGDRAERLGYRYSCFSSALSCARPYCAADCVDGVVSAAWEGAAPPSRGAPPHSTDRRPTPRCAREAGGPHSIGHRHTRYVVCSTPDTHFESDERSHRLRKARPTPPTATTPSSLTDELSPTTRSLAPTFSSCNPTKLRPFNELRTPPHKHTHCIARSPLSMAPATVARCLHREPYIDRHPLRTAERLGGSHRPRGRSITWSSSASTHPTLTRAALAALAAPSGNIGHLHPLSYVALARVVPSCSRYLRAKKMR